MNRFLARYAAFSVRALRGAMWGLLASFFFLLLPTLFLTGASFQFRGGAFGIEISAVGILAGMLVAVFPWSFLRRKSSEDRPFGGYPA